MRTILASVFALTMALSGASVATAWAGGGAPQVSRHHGDSWRNWRGHGHGHFRRNFSPRFRGHGGRAVIVVPGWPRVIPGYWAWNGYRWVWVPTYRVR